jgi:hypothetical protein
MKKILFLALLVALSFVSEKTTAQIVTNVRPAKDTIIGTDSTTVTFGSENTVKSFLAKVTRKGSTYIRGKVYLVGVYHDGTGSVNLDSVSITNTASSQYKLFLPSSTGILTYKQYKLKFVSDTTIGTWNVYGYQLRR